MLNNQKLLDGLTKIRDCSKIDAANGYKAGKVTERIVKEVESIYKKNMELIQLFASKDEKGMLLPGKVPGEFEFTVDKRKEFEKEKEKVETTQFVIQANRIDFAAVHDCHLTPAEITALCEAGILTEPQ